MQKVSFNNKKKLLGLKIKMIIVTKLFSLEDYEYT